MKIVVVSGGFDPVHSGHIQLFNSAKAYGDYLIVGLNSDAWLQRKKGRAFMSFDERSTIVMNLKAVDEVMSFNDDDGSANDLLSKVKQKYGDEHQIVFANGGDRAPDNIPEQVRGIHYIFGIGGDNKQNSSSCTLCFHFLYYFKLCGSSKMQDGKIKIGRKLKKKRRKNSLCKTQNFCP